MSGVLYDDLMILALDLRWKICTLDGLWTKVVLAEESLYFCLENSVSILPS